METKTIYVPVDVSEQDSKKHLFVKTYFGNAVCTVRKAEDMVVMTKGEFEIIKEGEFEKGYERGWDSCYIRKTI